MKSTIIYPKAQTRKSRLYLDFSLVCIHIPVTLPAMKPHSVFLFDINLSFPLSLSYSVQAVITTYLDLYSHLLPNILS